MPSLLSTVESFHAISVDLEDWYHVCGVKPSTAAEAAGRVVETTRIILELFHRHNIYATFFVLGSVAAEHPELLRKIADNGHEIASHGWSHRLVTELTPDEFRDELERTASIIESQTGCKPVGFRAPRWSLSRINTPWAFKILVESGYQYDSSLTPLAAIGETDGPLYSHLIETEAGNVWEIPPMVTKTPFLNLPTGGGWGFRFFPFSMIQSTLRKYTDRGQPAVIFVHPRELDPEGPRLDLGVFKGFVTYGSRTSSEDRLERLFSEFRFKPLGELVKTWQPAS